MRDFRDAKVMAHTLRASLASKGLKITVSQSLELIAELFGLPDWNTLAAAIRRGLPITETDASGQPRASVVWPSGFSRDLGLTLSRALSHAKERKHEFATLEHLLLALLDDPDASTMMKARKADLQALRQAVTAYIDEKLKTWVSVYDERDTTPTVAFRRVVHSATVRSLKRETSGLDVLAAMFRETESPAVWLLSEQGLSQETIVSDGGKPAAGSEGESPQDNVDESGKPVVQEVAVNAATLDGYVGFYRLDDDAVLAVTRNENHLVTRLTGQRQVPIYAQSNTEFFAKLVNARFIFIMGVKGQAASLVLHQHGQDHPMTRIDATTAQKIESKLAERVKSQSADPRSEAALRRLIDGLASGKPNYHEMIPALAELTRQQLPNLQMGHLDLGAVQSIKFLGVGRQGEDVYTVNHENGASHWRIKLDSKGAISMAAITPGP
jgi:hypothetical protein